MSEHRVLVIESAAKISVDHARLKVESEAGEPKFIAPTDIAVVCIDTPTASLSSAVLALLAANGAMVLISDPKHLPIGLYVPTCLNSFVSRRLRQQIDIDRSPLRARLWREIVYAKLKMQAQVLRRFDKPGALRLERLANVAENERPETAESQGARVYFKSLFPEGFKRSKEGAEDGINIRLNYGYAVLRAIVARAFASLGVNLSLGVGHCGSENPFNLADDFVEPYRPVVDHFVALQALTWKEAPEFRGSEKKKILEVIGATVKMAGQDWRLPAAADLTARSFVRNLEGGQERLLLPSGYLS